MTFNSNKKINNLKCEKHTQEKYLNTLKDQNTSKIESNNMFLNKNTHCHKISILLNFISIPMNYSQAIFLFLKLDNFMNVKMVHAYTQPMNQKKNVQKLGPNTYEDLCSPNAFLLFHFINIT